MTAAAAAAGEAETDGGGDNLCVLSEEADDIAPEKQGPSLVQSPCDWRA
jgi:hypothetical protein